MGAQVERAVTRGEVWHALQRGRNLAAQRVRDLERDLAATRQRGAGGASAAIGSMLSVARAELEEAESLTRRLWEAEYADHPSFPA